MHKDSSAGETASAGHDPDARDGGLLRRLQEDDAAALEEVLGLYWTPLRVYVLQIFVSLDGAEDVVQYVFIELWSRRKACHTSIRVYLYRAVRNMSLNKQLNDMRRLWLLVRVDLEH